MKDQVASFQSRGVSAAHLSGDVNDEVKMGIISGSYKLVFLSPELLLTKKKWQSMLQSQIYCDRLVALVVDEAHCAKNSLNDTLNIHLNSDSIIIR